MAIGRDAPPRQAAGTLPSSPVVESRPAAPEPTVAKAPGPTAHASPAPPSGLHPRVLLADDNRDLQQILAQQLVLLGLEVLGVSNGRDAVDLGLSAHRAGNPFDLILMDLEMPTLDGYQATRQLREGGYAGPILALTAHSADDFRLDCLRIGCNDCLGKPFDWGELRALVQKYLPGRSLSGQGVPRPD